MKKELVEEALTNIDDKYIEEAITYDKSKIINCPQNTSKLMKAATVTLAVLVAGSATIYAGATVARKVFITDHSMEMGTLDDSEEEELREDDMAEENLGPDDSYWDEVEDLGTVAGDDSVKWTQKHDEIVQGVHYTTYTYENYNDAAADAGMDAWFDSIPGELTSVEYTYGLSEGCATRYIFVNGEYKGHTYSLMQDKMNGVDDEDFFYRIAMDNVQNARDYTNKDGELFTLADEVREYYEYSDYGSTKKVKDITTYTMIRDNGNAGNMSFDNMPDKDIHYILDQIKLVK